MLAASEGALKEIFLKPSLIGKVFDAEEIEKFLHGEAET
jgi:hypothetical protein